MIKLNAGFSRKVGEANYSSRGASVNLELELESSMIDSPDKMHARIRALFRLARNAVDEELRNGSHKSEPDRGPAKTEAKSSDGPLCSECGKQIQSQKVVEFSTERFGKPICYRCQREINGDNERR